MLGVTDPEHPDATAAFSALMMQQNPLLNTEVGDTLALVINERSSASYVAFERVVDGRELTFVGESKNSFARTE